MSIKLRLNPILLEPIVRAALTEDLGRAGDITTNAIVPEDLSVTARIVSRRTGAIAGCDAAVAAFRLLDPDAECIIHKTDGSGVEPGDIVMTVTGRARAILTAERVALNFVCHLSGIATATAELVAAAHPHKARITCTRKTTPGLRFLEKAAVRAGGGVNHRFGLDDAVLIKDNHVALAGGVAKAIDLARASVGHLVKLEVEVDTLEQLDEALEASPDAVLLDNMSSDDLRAAVITVARRIPTEASGNISIDNVAEIAETGVDLISAGWLTHSARSLDLSLEIN